MSFTSAEVYETMAAEIGRGVSRPEGYLPAYRTIKRGARKSHGGHYKWDQVEQVEQLLKQGFSVRYCIFTTGLCRDTVKKVARRLLTGR